MPLSESAQDELRAELAAIDTLRKQMTQKLDARADVIRAVLEPFDFNQAALPFAQSDRQATVASAAPKDDLDSRVRAALAPTINIVVRNKFASTGLRAAILGVLEEHGPLKAKSVAQILHQTGFKNDSKTPLQTRVYNDLWRMIEPGLVENNDGVFRLKKSA